MALQLPDNFKNDIQGRDTSLVPVVVIGNAENNIEDVNLRTSIWQNESIVISTNSFNINEFSGGYSYSITVKPILLNIPSLKESIDIEKRHYQISSINIDISNMIYEGERFSGLFTNSLINTECRIYWFTPSTTQLTLYQTSNSDAFQVYNGTIRRYTHDDEKVRLVVEDRSQATLHKDLPLPENYLGTGDDVPDKYKNKPIPMVYGYVDRSPCVLKIKKDSEGNETQTTIVAETASCDFVTSDTGLINEKSPLFIYEDKYYPIVNNNFQLDYETAQYLETTNNAEIVLNYEYLPQTGDFIPNSNIVNNQLEIKVIRRPLSVFPMDNPPYTQQTGGDGVMGEGDYDFVDYFSNLDNIKISGLDSGDLAPINISALTHAGIICVFEPTREDYICKTFVGLLVHAKRPSEAPQGSNATNGNMVLRGTNTAGVLFKATTDLFTLDDTDEWHIRNSLSVDAYSSPDLYELEDWDSVNIANQLHFWSGAGLFTRFNLEAKWYEVLLVQHAYITSPLAKDFYVNVNGRADTFYTGGSALMQIPCDIVYHLLREELGAGNIATDTTGLIQSREEHSGWKFGFTQNKKINSKKLLEGIMSSSKSLLRFKAQGEYDFITIRDFVSWVDHDILIIDDEIISIKYSKTKIEDVHTSVIVEYNKDYARDEYSSLPPINADGLFGEDSTSFYGLKSDHSESEKTFTTDYIRKETAAKLWQLFLLNWYCNQHLLIFLDLPLKYMNIEVGDIVCFNKASEVLPYGIDYGLDANQDFNTLQQVNHQDVYPQFLVYETNKQLDKVSVKCIQMHKIDNTYTAPESDDVEFNLEDTIAATNYDDTQQIIKGLLE